MALLQILLLLLYALPSLLLPITSNPLGLEDTPDNLAWAAQSFESRSEHEGVRKIPKSIFILPNHHETPQDCQDGYKMQDGKCHKAQNFDVNPLALITSQFQQFLNQDPTTVDFDEDYDYGDVNYDSNESKPYRVQLDLSAANDPPARDTVNDGIQNLPFLADNFDPKQETSQKYAVPTTNEYNSTKHDNVVPIPGTFNSNDDNWADDNLANNKDSIRTDEVVKPTTPSNDVVATTPYESLLIFNDEISISTTQKKVLVDAHANLPDNEFLEKKEENTLYTEKEQNPTTTFSENESSDSGSTTLSNRETEKPHSDNHLMENNQLELTTLSDDQKFLDKELQSESLFQDDSSIITPINVSDGTTEISENDIEVTTEPINDKEANKMISISSPRTQFKTSNKTQNPIVVVPTVEQVQIMTPVQVTTTSQSTTNHRKKSNSQSIPSSTSTYNSELQTAERFYINDSMLNKKMRESVMKHELNEDARETIDANNRFVYTHLDSPHLDSSSNEAEPTTSTTMQPVTQRSLIDQLRFINKFTEDSNKNNRVRFPELSTVNIFSNFKGGTVRFPGPVLQRTSEPNLNRLIPDHIPKKPPEPTAERPLFSWLPPGTSFDFSRNSNPVFMKFWSKMPLIRDSSMMTSNDSPDQPRSYSKSPTDNLYKDAPASEIYKVISSKNYKHDNR